MSATHANEVHLCQEHLEKMKRSLRAGHVLCALEPEEHSALLNYVARAEATRAPLCVLESQ